MAIQGGDVVWRIIGDDAQLQKTMKNVGLGMAAAGAAITGALGVMVKGFIDYGDTLAKASDRTGIAVESIARLKYAAEQSGIGIDTIETALKRMSRTVDEARQGTGTYVEAFDRLNISVASLDGLNPEEMFLVLSDALAQVSDHTTKAALAQEIFGRGGLELLPMLKDGAAGVKALGLEAESLGLVMDEKTARAAEKLGDDFTRLKMSLFGVMLEIGPALVPELTKLTLSLRDVAVSASGWIKRNPELTATLIKVTAAVGAFLFVMGPVLMMLANLSIVLKGVAGGFALLGGGTAAGAGSGIIGAAATALAGATTAFVATAAAAVAAGIAIGATVGALYIAIKAGRGMVLAEREADATMMKLAATLEAKGVALDKASLASMEHAEAVEYLKKQITQAERVYGREISALNGVRSMHNATGEQAVKSTEKTQRGYEKLSGVIEQQSMRWHSSLATLSLDTRHSPSINDMVAKSLDNLLSIYYTRIGALMNWIADAMKWIGAQMADIWGMITGGGGAMRATAITGASGRLSQAGAQRSVASAGGGVNVGGVTVNVNAAGQDGAQIARVIARELPRVLGEEMRLRAGQRGLAWGT